MQDQFQSLLEKGKLAPFVEWLKTLDTPQRRKLAPAIKKLEKEYLKYHEVRSGNSISFKQKATETQSKMLQVACFVCYTQAEYEKSEFPGWIIDPERLNLAIDWYHPEWFSDFVNKLAQSGNMFHTANYGFFMELHDKGFLTLSNQLIATTLPQFIYGYEGRQAFCKPGKLLLHPLTLQEHIWALFETESNIHYNGRWMNIQNTNPNEPTEWIGILRNFSDENLISREHLLKQSLLAANRNFNKVLSGWFIDLFIALKPSDKEVLSLQKELFSLFNSIHSKPVNTALNYFKKILKDPGFNVDLFLEITPTLLTSNTKNIVSGTLMIMDKLANAYPNKKQTICTLVTQAFMHADDDLQTRTAKIIATNCIQANGKIIEALEPYRSNLMVSAAQILKPLLQQNNNDAIKEEGLLHDVNLSVVNEPIPAIETFDDLIFLCSQAFDNNKSWHFDVLPAALLQWQHTLTGANINLLQPALQRAIKTIKNGGQGNAGTLDHMLAIFFCDVCILLIRRFPNDSSALNTLFDLQDAKDQANTRWLNIGHNTSYIEKYKQKGLDSFYRPFLVLLVNALNKFRTADKLPLLSTPTHEPAWLDPLIFAKRMHQYVIAKLWPDSMDLQVAISRCHLLDTGEAIDFVNQHLTGEARNLLLFLLNESASPKGTFNHEAAWMVASLAKKKKQQYDAFSYFSYYKKPLEYYTGRFAFETVVDQFTNRRYDYQLKKEIPYTDTHTILRLIKTDAKQSTDWIKKLLQIVKTAKPAEPILFDYMSVTTDYMWEQHKDVRRALLLTPNNPEPFLSSITEKAFKHGDFCEEGSKKAVIQSLQAMHEIWSENSNGTMANLFVATSMISSDKTAAIIAAEIWLQAATIKQINSELIGTILGMHLKVNYAPMKRFTDLAMLNMYNVYPQTNEALKKMIEAMLIMLPDEPIKNLKKLLELYRELLARYPALPDNADLMIRQFETWTISPTIKTIAADLCKMLINKFLNNGQ